MISQGIPSQWRSVLQQLGVTRSNIDIGYRLPNQVSFIIPDYIVSDNIGIIFHQSSSHIASVKSCIGTPLPAVDLAIRSLSAHCVNVMAVHHKL